MSGGRSSCADMLRNLLLKLAGGSAMSHGTKHTNCLRNAPAYCEKPPDQLSALACSALGFVVGVEFAWPQFFFVNN